MDVFNKADFEGQSKVIPTLKNLFSGCTLNIEQHYNTKNPVDIYITATTKNNTEHYYAIECKHRNFAHTKFEKYGYIIEHHKVKELMKESQRGYKPIYLNSFNDGYMLIWNLEEIDFNECGETGELTFKKTTVLKDETRTYKLNKITLMKNQCVWRGKMKL